MDDPFSIPAVFTFFSAAVKFAEVAATLYSFDTANGVFVRTIQTAKRDLEEVERFLTVPTVRQKIINTPGKLPWIKAVILSTKVVINAIGMWVEGVRNERHGYGKSSLESLLRLVFFDDEKVVNFHRELNTSHQALANLLLYLTLLEMSVEETQEEGLPEYHDATFLDVCISPRQMQKNRMSQRSTIFLRSAIKDHSTTGYQAIRGFGFQSSDSSGGDVGDKTPQALETSTTMIPEEPIEESTHSMNRSSWQYWGLNAAPSSWDLRMPYEYNNLPKQPISRPPYASKPQQSQSAFAPLHEESSSTTFSETAVPHHSSTWSQNRKSTSSQPFSSISLSPISEDQSKWREENHRPSTPVLLPKVPLREPNRRSSSIHLNCINCRNLEPGLKSNFCDTFRDDQRRFRFGNNNVVSVINVARRTSYGNSSASVVGLPETPFDTKPTHIAPANPKDRQPLFHGASSYYERSKGAVSPNPLSTRNTNTDQSFHDQRSSSVHHSSSLSPNSTQPKRNPFRPQASTYGFPQRELAERLAFTPPLTRAASFTATSSQTSNTFSIPLRPDLSRSHSENTQYRVFDQIPEDQERDSTDTYRHHSPIYNQYPPHQQQHSRPRSDTPLAQSVSEASSRLPSTMDDEVRRRADPTPVSPSISTGSSARSGGIREIVVSSRTMAMREARRRSQRVMLGSID